MSETDQQLASRVATEAGAMLVELRDELVAEGVVVRRQGRGTYVVEHDLKRPG